MYQTAFNKKFTQRIPLNERLERRALGQIFTTQTDGMITHLAPPECTSLIDCSAAGPKLGAVLMPDSVLSVTTLSVARMQKGSKGDVHWTWGKP